MGTRRGEDVTELGGGRVDIDRTRQMASYKAAGKSAGSSKDQDRWSTGSEGCNGSGAEGRGHGTSLAAGEEADETCCFRAPAAGDLEGQDPAPRRAQQPGVRALRGFARGTKGCASNTARRDAPLVSSAETKVTSTASCAPPQSGTPLAGDCGAGFAAYTSCGSLQKGRSNPEREHAARWSPKTPNGRRQRQVAAASGSGRRRRRKIRTRMDEGSR